MDVTNDEWKFPKGFKPVDVSHDYPQVDRYTKSRLL